MANRARGEIKIKLGEAEHVLTPTYAALAEIEDKLDTGLVMLAQKFETADLSLRDFTVVITACLRANSQNGSDIDEVEIGEAIIKEGMMNFIKPISELIRAPLVGVKSKADKDSAKND